MSSLNFQRLLVIAFLVWALCMLLTGCSATEALTGLVGSKPEITAQAGAENTKQTVGLNNKVDQYSRAETTVKDSQVGKVDSSNGKKTSASSITAEVIKADKIEIRNGSEDSTLWKVVSAVAFLLLMAALIIYYVAGRKTKGA